MCGCMAACSNRPPTLRMPLWSKKGLSRYSLLVLSLVISLCDSRSSISLEKTSLCVMSMMVSSASYLSSRLVASLVLCIVSFNFLRNLWSLAIAFTSLVQLENLRKRLVSESVVVEVWCTMTLRTSGSLVSSSLTLTSPLGSSSCQRKSGPLNQLEAMSSFALSPREIVF